MSIPIDDDELWQLVQPLLPVRPRRYRYPGRKPLDDGKVLDGILYVLATGITLGAAAQAAGLRLGHDLLAAAAGLERRRRVGAAPPALLARLRQADQLDWSRVVIDAAHLRALKGGTSHRLIHEYLSQPEA